jgi:hypothetical protein
MTKLKVKLFIILKPACKPDNVHPHQQSAPCIRPAQNLSLWKSNGMDAMVEPWHDKDGWYRE